jgi:hypothetical protein
MQRLAQPFTDSVKYFEQDGTTIRCLHPVLKQVKRVKSTDVTTSLANDTREYEDSGHTVWPVSSPAATRILRGIDSEQDVISRPLEGSATPVRRVGFGAG